MPSSPLPRRRGTRTPQRNRTPLTLAVERLEDRLVPSTFTVTNLQDVGQGSLRRAVLNANAHPGADVIAFDVAGTIRLTTGALPALTDKVNVDGTTAPGFAGTPLVEVDFNRFAGLRFVAGSAGSAVRSLGLIRATGAGVTLDGVGHMTIAGNYVGLRLDGTTPAGNTGDGVLLKNSHHNLIGHDDPVTGVSFYNADSVPTQPVSGWQGIRGSDTPGQVLISGTSDANGLLFDGTIAGVGTSYSVNYPGAATTSVYGPDNLSGSAVRLVGTYKNSDYATAAVEVNGFVFEGTTADLATAANYRTIDFPGAKFNYVHSTMGGLAVGNYDSPVDHGKFNLPLGPGHAYLYDLAHDTFLTDVAFPGSISNTAYGIWYNGGTSYTICGGYSPDPVNNFDDQTRPLGRGYLVDYNSATGKFGNWTAFDYPFGQNFITHFEGISSVEKGVYTLSADSVQAGTSDPAQGSWVSVRRNPDGSFGPATWVNLNYTGVDPTTHITSSNAVYGNQVVGIVIGQGTFSFQATVNTGFQLSNVIGANGGNGVELDHSNGNRIAMNFIGTDATGKLRLGNRGNGVLLTNGSSANVIGGQATGGNDPTNGVFVRPPQGNLISANGGDGVLINGTATNNLLSGNFIGTDACGNAALGNALDGVEIRNADGNQLIGCTLRTNPFVFYNVISGNGRNGLTVANSDHTTIQANFFGMGADNATAVGNAGNGVVVAGTSADTTMGGPIPLGNVDAANGGNGLVVRDTASGFVTYNTFCGLAAFSTDPNFGNGRDGMLITSTGGDVLIRTNVITRNGDDGIEISGDAHGVRVLGNIIGLDTQGNAPMGNVGNGVEVGGTAHDVVIGSPQPTFNIIPHNAISANGGHGIAIVGGAHDVRVNHSYVGTDLIGTAALGNAGDGVFVGPGTRSTTIGSLDPDLLTVISGNGGAGVELSGTHGNTLVGALIGTDALGLLPLGNGGSGVLIIHSYDNVIGRADGPVGVPANLIAFNGGAGVLVASGIRNGVLENSIYGNASAGIDLQSGANRNQAPPVLTFVRRLPMSLRVSGALMSRPNTTFTIEFFANDVSGPSGRLFLGALKVRTNGSGVVGFTFDGPLPPATAGFITATATDSENNTSQFSAAVS